VLNPSALIDPDIVEQNSIVDAAVGSSAEPSFLLSDVHRRADFEDTIGQRPCYVDITGAVVSIAESIRPVIHLAFSAIKIVASVTVGSDLRHSTATSD
jgi:hypothetical protein